MEKLKNIYMLIFLMLPLGIGGVFLYQSISNIKKEISSKLVQPIQINISGDSAGMESLGKKLDTLLALQEKRFEMDIALAREAVNDVKAGIPSSKIVAERGLGRETVESIKNMLMT